MSFLFTVCILIHESWKERRRTIAYPSDSSSSSTKVPLCNRKVPRVASTVRTRSTVWWNGRRMAIKVANQNGKRKKGDGEGIYGAERDEAGVRRNSEENPHCPACKCNVQQRTGRIFRMLCLMAIQGHPSPIRATADASANWREISMITKFLHYRT